MNDLSVIDPEIEALEAEVAAGRKAKQEAAEKQAAAEAALVQLVVLSKLEGKRIGPICRELRGEMAAVHPEWNRAGRRMFVRSFRRKGHK